MPQILAAAASAFSAAAPTVATATAAAAPSLTSVAMKLALNVAISAAMSAMQPQVGAAGKTFEWTLDPNAPIAFAAGRVGVAGTVVHLETFGPDKMYYGFNSVLSGSGPIKRIVGFKGDDEDVTFDANGKAISSQWAGEMWFRSRLGTQPDTALTSPPALKSGATLPNWTAAHKLSGKACYMLVLGENSKRTAYPTGEPKPLVTIEGLFGWDPRQDSTYPGGFGPCRLNNPATWVWIENPILWGLKWALGLWEGPTGKGAPGVDYQVGGIGADVSGIDIPTLVAAANIADANGWKVAAYPTTDDDKAAVLDAFLQAGGAIYAQRAGKISCIQRAAPRTSIVTITARDTAGPLEIDTAASRIDRINTIRARFWSEAHRWQMTAIDDVTSAEWKAQDGQTRPRGIDYTFVPLADQAAQLAALQIAHTREGIAGRIPLKPHLQRIAPGSVFTISEPGFLLNGVECLCLNTEYDPATGVVMVTFVSETSGKYAYALGQTAVPPEPAVLTPYDPTVSPPAPGDWEVVVRPPATGGGRVPGFDVVGSVDNATATAILVEWGPTDAGPWMQAYLGPPAVERIPLTGIQPGDDYFVAVSNIRNQNTSARQVYGPYTAPPMISDDTGAVDGVGAPELVARLVDAEALVAATDAAVGEILSGYPSIMDAVEDAEGARDIATVRAGEAGGSATAAAGSASAALVSEGAAGGAAAAAIGAATASEAAEGAAQTYATQSSEARDGAVAASIEAGTAAITANAAAATATVESSEASDAAARATASASIAASVGNRALNRNSGFDDYPVTPGLPTSWSPWDNAGTITRQPGPTGGYSVLVETAAGNNGGIVQAVPGKPNAYYVAEADVTAADNGVFTSAGFTIQALNAAESSVFMTETHPLSGEDSSGNLAGAGVDNQRYTYSHFFQTPDEVSIAKLFIYGMNKWSAFGSIAGTARIIWHSLLIRPATPAEIAAGVALPTLAASVSETQDVVADLEDQYDLARWQVTGSSSGGDAVLGVVSDTYGTDIYMGADNIWFGENTFFDDATDTLRTVTGTSQRVIALGAPFGATGDLIQWEGASSVAFSAMGRANARFYSANAAPYLGGTALPGGPVFTVTASAMAVNKRGNYGSGTLTTPAVTLTPTNATGAVTYAWTFAYGDEGVTANSAASAVTTFSGDPGPGGALSCIYVWSATDAAGKIQTGQVYVVLTENDPGDPPV